MRLRKAYQGTVPENKILDTYSASQTDTYSCNYANGIAESGSNGGVNYVKYGNGTIMVWGTIRLNCGTTKTTYFSTVNLPVTFKDTSYIVNIMPSNAWAYYTGLFPCAGTKTTTTCQVGGWYDSGVSTGGNIDYIIIGKWK